MFDWYVKSMAKGSQDTNMKLTLEPTTHKRKQFVYALILAVNVAFWGSMLAAWIIAGGAQ